MHRIMRLRQPLPAEHAPAAAAAAAAAVAPLPHARVPKPAPRPQTHLLDTALTAPSTSASRMRWPSISTTWGGAFAAGTAGRFAHGTAALRPTLQGAASGRRLWYRHSQLAGGTGCWSSGGRQHAWLGCIQAMQRGIAEQRTPWAPCRGALQCRRRRRRAATHLLAAVGGQLRLLHTGGGPASLWSGRGGRECWGGWAAAAALGLGWLAASRCAAQCTSNAMHGRSTCTRTLRRAARAARGRAWAGANAVHDMAVDIGCGLHWCGVQGRWLLSDHLLWLLRGNAAALMLPRCSPCHHATLIGLWEQLPAPGSPPGTAGRGVNPPSQKFEPAERCSGPASQQLPLDQRWIAPEGGGGPAMRSQEQVRSGGLKAPCPCQLAGHRMLIVAAQSRHSAAYHCPSPPPPPRCRLQATLKHVPRHRFAQLSFKAAKAAYLGAEIVKAFDAGPFRGKVAQVQRAAAAPHR